MRIIISLLFIFAILLPSNEIWDVSEYINPIDDSKSILFSISANETVSSKGIPINFVLKFNTKDFKSYALVEWGDILGSSLQIPVIMRIGDSDAAKFNWTISKNQKETIYEHNGGLLGHDNMYIIDFITQLLPEDKLILKISPKGSNSITASFNISGLKDLVLSKNKILKWIPTKYEALQKKKINDFLLNVSGYWFTDDDFLKVTYEKINIYENIKIESSIFTGSKSCSKHYNSYDGSISNTSDFSCSDFSVSYFSDATVNLIIHDKNYTFQKESKDNPYYQIYNFNSYLEGNWAVKLDGDNFKCYNFSLIDDYALNFNNINLFYKGVGFNSYWGTIYEYENIDLLNKGRFKTQNKYSFSKGNKIVIERPNTLALKKINKINIINEKNFTLKLGRGMLNFRKIN